MIPCLSFFVLWNYWKKGKQLKQTVFSNGKNNCFWGNDIIKENNLKILKRRVMCYWNRTKKIQHPKNPLHSTVDYKILVLTGSDKGGPRSNNTLGWEMLRLVTRSSFMKSAKTTILANYAYYTSFFFLLYWF